MTRPLQILSLAGALLAATFTPAVAQQARPVRCVTDEHTAQLRATFHDPELSRQAANAERLAQAYQDGTVAWRPATATRVIPLVVHVVTMCGAQAINKAQIEAGVAQLNADWAKQNTDTTLTLPIFKQRAANLDVEFQLAKLDPQGNPTDGIDRVTSITTDHADPRDLVKSAVPYWPNYFNVWLVDGISGATPPSVILGYAQFPGTGPWDTWGVVMLYNDWTSPIGNGRTAAHEVGHCFNLFHTFQGGCGSSCSTTGDRVCDTPPQATATAVSCAGAPTANTCHNDNPDLPDPTQNFMSYDDCQTMFTVGQKARVDACFTSFPYIGNLITPANLLAAGLAPGQNIGPLGPRPYFASCVTRVCQGSSITFTDGSFGGPVANRQWTFTGAAVATDTARTVTVTFNTPGLQTVTLLATGVAGTVALPAYSAQVQVIPSGVAQAPLNESFEDPTFPANTNYLISSNQGPTYRSWEKYTPQSPGIASDGNVVLRVVNSALVAGALSRFETPSLDTRNLNASPAPTLSFDIAYARRSAASSDRLAVSYSIDCGRNWIAAGFDASGQALATTTSFASSFVPQANDWQTKSVSKTRFANQPSIMFKFESTAGATAAATIYLDNLRFNGQPLGLVKSLEAADASLAPNPLTDETMLALTLPRPAQVALTVRDVLGRPVLQDAPRALAPGEHTLPLGNRLRVAAGVYVVTLTVDGQLFTQGLLVR